ncbi:hypothetical protein [Variovorax sp. ZT4R33]|uniref:hypothetical protein n=1 Tax=Variovorax sp. ZT4R33 TaxID=3443743 RepID=UPI003F469C71
MLRDALPEHELLSANASQAPAEDLSFGFVDDATAAAHAKQARVERMGRRLKQLVQAADVPCAPAVAA